MKNDTVEMLEKVLETSLQRDATINEYYRLTSPYLPIHFIIRFITGALLGQAVMTMTEKFYNTPVIGLFSTFIGVVLSITVLIYVFFGNMLQTAWRKHKNKDEIERLRKESNILLQQMADLGMPNGYQYTEAIRFLLQVVENGRADDLKEALNLYEKELKHLDQMEKLDELSNLQKQQLEEAKKSSKLQEKQLEKTKDVIFYQKLYRNK